ncbi:MAG: GxxExxY protein [Candidatus Cloacimonadaceae bacterium]
MTYKVRGTKFKVYNELVPSLLESTYEAALVYEFGKIV